MRTNITKDKVIKILKKEHLLSISDISKKIPETDFSTIYRNIEKLIEENKVKKIVLDKDNVMYEVLEENLDHDHFICTECGHIDEVKKTANSIKNVNKITEVLYKGVCQKCY